MDSHFLFYVEPESVSGNTVTFSEHEVHHMSRVLRKKEGDGILVTNGCGYRFEVILQRIEKKRATGIIQKAEKLSVGRHITLAMGVIRQKDRLEYAIEKAVELGVSRILLVHSEFAGKVRVKEARIEGAILSAMKQSGRCYKPEWGVSSSFQEAIEAWMKKDDLLYYGEMEGEHPMTLTRENVPAFLVIGPEGGLSGNEVHYLKESGGHPVRLGSARLRAETAVCAMMAFAAMTQER
ncbi:RsmE family RNA methyltransferase [Balneolaceae bacterium ANBcel3]|nr:RsmE family RNA methyltransferase [Balneolaceae bacterium ANBcel3]